MNEIWKSITGYEGYYEVSNLGRVRSLEHFDQYGHRYKSRVLVPQTRPNGYKCVHLSREGKSKWLSIHRLVALEFCEKPDGMNVVNHIDNNPANNCASNLEWTNYKGNMQHATKQGRMGWQPENLAKAVEAIKKPVIAIAKDGTRQIFESAAEAARKLGVSRGHIAACCRQEYGCKTVGGFKFEYADPNLQAKQTPNRVAKDKDELIEELRQRMKGNKYGLGKKPSEEAIRKTIEAKSKPVNQIDKETNEVIACFSSVTEAKRKTGISHIDGCARGDRKTAGGYIWRYI